MVCLLLQVGSVSNIPSGVIVFRDLFSTHETTVGLRTVQLTDSTDPGKTTSSNRSRQLAMCTVHRVRFYSQHFEALVLNSNWQAMMPG